MVSEANEPGSEHAARSPRIVRRSHYDHPDSLLKVVSTRGVVAAVVRLAPGLELVDHPVEVLAGLLAELLPHLAHPACHALGIVLVEPGEGAVVGERVEPALLRASEREARHQARERAAPAVLAHRLDRLAHTQGEDGHRPLAPPAAVLVDRHTDPDYSREPGGATSTTVADRCRA